MQGENSSGLPANVFTGQKTLDQIQNGPVESLPQPDMHTLILHYQINKQPQWRRTKRDMETNSKNNLF